MHDNYHITPNKTHSSKNKNNLIFALIKGKKHDFEPSLK